MSEGEAGGQGGALQRGTAYDGARGEVALGVEHEAAATTHVEGDDVEHGAYHLPRAGTLADGTEADGVEHVPCGLRRGIGLFAFTLEHGLGHAAQQGVGGQRVGSRFGCGIECRQPLQEIVGLRNALHGRQADEAGHGGVEGGLQGSLARGNLDESVRRGGSRLACLRAASCLGTGGGSVPRAARGRTRRGASFVPRQQRGVVAWRQGLAFVAERHGGPVAFNAGIGFVGAQGGDGGDDFELLAGLERKGEGHFAATLLLPVFERYPFAPHVPRGKGVGEAGVVVQVGLGGIAGHCRAAVGTDGAFVNEDDIHILTAGTAEGVVQIDEKTFFGCGVGIGVELFQKCGVLGEFRPDVVTGEPCAAFSGGQSFGKLVAGGIGHELRGVFLAHVDPYGVAHERHLQEAAGDVGRGGLQETAQQLVEVGRIGVLPRMETGDGGEVLRLHSGSRDSQGHQEKEGGKEGGGGHSGQDGQHGGRRKVS